jgi:hypothetical protein
MKKYILLLIIILASICFADIKEVVPIDIEGNRTDPGQVHTPRTTWTIVDETTSSGTEPTDLAVTERTFQAVKIAIDAASSGDDEISVFDIPKSWNAINLRALGITDDGTYTTQIYLGTLGKGNNNSDITDAQVTAGILPFNCELVNIGQLAWTVGTQESVYSQVAFTSGGTTTIMADMIILGATSASTATVVSVTVSSGTFAGGDAAGTLVLKNRNGTFQSENLDIANSSATSIASNVATIGGDLTHFELADTLTITNATTWPKSWGSTSPTGNLVANASIDILNADLLVIVPTAASADSKLLASGE